MGVLTNLEPERVFYYFEEITKIPHGSGNVEQISNFLADFAKNQGLKYIQDQVKNIIIFKPATVGYENEPTVILQGHMDMVAVNKPDYPVDMKKEGLKVQVKDDLVYAEGTSLGGDDGIAVAYALAILESDTIKHPALEVIITVDEEVGMDGAREIDLSMLKGSRMINLDSEEEGFFLTSCAGGGRVDCILPVVTSTQTGIVFDILVGGLIGGHSGAEIHKERGNSNKLFGRLLYELCKEIEVKLVSAKGGLADNAISRETKASVMIAENDIDKFADIINRCKAEIGDELATKDPNFTINFEQSKMDTVESLDYEQTKKVAMLLEALPNGVMAMSADMEGLVETSLNLGILELSKECLTAEFAVRSSVESAKADLINQVVAVTELAGGRCEITGDYPGWKYRVDSPLRDKMIKVFKELYGKEPVVQAIHAGLECGILGNKIKDLDCVSIGPDMKDIHTTEETLSISSTKRVWEFLLAVLADK